MSLYVYGVVGAGERLDVEDAGLGPVRLVESGDVAALCSDITDDPLGRRRELKAHADVLAAACLQTTVVPFSFGTVLPDEAEVRTRLLDRHRDHLRGELDRLRDVLQLNVRLVPDEQRLLADVVTSSPELTRLRASVNGSAASQAQQLRLGEAVAHAYRHAGERIGTAVLDTLAEVSVDLRVEDIGGPEATTRAAFLVARDRVTGFLESAQVLAEGLQGRVVCRVVGPLPPFSFVVSLPSGPEGAQSREPSWAS